MKEVASFASAFTALAAVMFCVGCKSAEIPHDLIGEYTLRNSAGQHPMIKNIKLLLAADGTFMVEPYSGNDPRYSYGVIRGKWAQKDEVVRLTLETIGTTPVEKAKRTSDTLIVQRYRLHRYNDTIEFASLDNLTPPHSKEVFVWTKKASHSSAENEPGS